LCYNFSFLIHKVEMKNIFIIIILFLKLNLSFSEPHLNTLDGHELYGKDLKGKWLVLEYWASWCDICMGELPHLSKVYQKLDHSKIQLFLVNYDGLSPSEIQHLLNKNKVDIPSLSGRPAAMFGIRSISALPMMIVINPKGKVDKVMYGPEASHYLKKL
jgi:thiol-disulfide isomerase/thioredoxin